MPMNPLLGYILPKDRTPAQEKAHEDAMSGIKKFKSPKGFVEMPKGEKLMLTDFWKRPEVVTDIGRPFTRFRQITGSCVGASTGNAVTTLLTIQRCLSKAPTKASAIFWPWSYGKCRANEGDNGPGEGAVDSVMGQTVSKDGFFDITQPGLPSFDYSDGFALSQSVEMEWSNGQGKDIQQFSQYAKGHTLTQTSLSSTEDIMTAIQNLKPVINGCDKYVGSGSIQGSALNAAAIGNYDGDGGHSTCFLGVWNHPTLGYLLLYSNQWDGNTYPDDGSGKGECTVWMPQKEVDNLFKLGGSGGETMAWSDANWFTIQDALNWLA